MSFGQVGPNCIYIILFSSGCRGTGIDALQYYHFCRGKKGAKLLVLLYRQQKCCYIFRTSYSLLLQNCNLKAMDLTRLHLMVNHICGVILKNTVQSSLFQWHAQFNSLCFADESVRCVLKTQDQAAGHLVVRALPWHSEGPGFEFQDC